MNVLDADGDGKVSNKEFRDHWLNRRWRPAMAWMYLTVCVFDFIVFPLLWSGHLGYIHQAITQWEPLTLKAGGFFHLTMGAIIGIAAWNRTKEKLADKSGVGH